MTGLFTIKVGGKTLPSTLSTDETARLLGCSGEYLRTMGRDGADSPLRPLVLGNRLRWPTAAVARLLELEVEVCDPSAYAKGGIPPQDLEAS